MSLNIRQYSCTGIALYLLSVFHQLGWDIDAVEEVVVDGDRDALEDFMRSTKPLVDANGYENVYDMLMHDLSLLED